MNLTLKVTQKPNTDMSGLLKRMCSLKCQIKVNLEDSNIFIYNMAESDTDDVLNAIRDTFDIISIDKTDADDSANATDSAETGQSDITEEPLSLNLGGIKDKCVLAEIKKLIRTIKEVMDSPYVNSMDICRYVRESNFAMQIKYNPIPIKCEIGNIVLCNYVGHLKRDIIGKFICGIICDIDVSGLVYIVPITKRILKASPMNLEFSNGKDIYIKSIKIPMERGTALLKGGGYISPFRISRVMGYVSPQFFKKVLDALPSATDFSPNYDNYEEKLRERLKITDMYNCEIPEIQEAEANSAATETNNADVSEASTEIAPNSDAEDTADKDIRIPVEKYLTILLADALNYLDDSAPVEIQIDIFLDTIGFSRSDAIIRESFIASCTVKKINYEGIILELRKKFPQYTEDMLKKALIDKFKEWLIKNPELKEKYPKISIMTVLKVFAKRMSGR